MQTGHHSTNSATTRCATLTLCATTLFLLALASSAVASPNHPRLAAQDITGLNHACGAAVDSKGDVYASSAGESKIKVFNPAHTELTSIADSHEPCGLAVDANGDLYVSDQAPHQVVKYHPSAYPPTGSTTYGSTTIDSSGNAKGISIDPNDNRLYVAEGGRISSFDSEGNLGINEAQRVLVFEATGGTFKLIFGGQETGPIPWNATHAEVQVALEGLSTIGAGNVAVTQGPQNSGNPKDHRVTFKGTFSHTEVETLTANTSGLTGGINQLVLGVEVKSFSGHIGEGNLVGATGVAAYTSSSGDRHLFVADATTDQVKTFGGSDIRSLKLRRTISGPSAGESFGFGGAGAYLAVDPGNRNTEDKCSSVAEQACTAGHLLVYDVAHQMVDEFDASGEFLDQFTTPAFADAAPTALAIDRSGGPGDGTIYVTAGSAAGAKLLAFGPLAAPSRSSLPALSHVLVGAKAVATDSHGDVYVAAGAEIHIFSPLGAPLGEVEDPESPFDIDVDSTGRLYVLDSGPGIGTEKVTYYTPSSYPPGPGTTYARREPRVIAGSEFPVGGSSLNAIAVDPANDHLFVTSGGFTRELGSAAEGSPVLKSEFAGKLSLGQRQEVAVQGSTGNVYFTANPGGISIVNSAGTEVLVRINGAGGAQGKLGSNPRIAVDQANGHVVDFENEQTGVAQEFDASGAFVAQFGAFTKNLARPSRVAIDNSGGPNDGNVYVAFNDTKSGTPDVWAFGPLAYGEPPLAHTGVVNGIGGDGASLNGTVNPRGFDLTDCHFEYITDAAFKATGFSDLSSGGSAPCLPGPAEIGKGAGPVAVHGAISGLDPDGRYDFRLLAENKYGSSEGEPALFGPPVITARSALPILYDEATLRANLDPSGLPTRYHFEYVDQARFEAEGGFAGPGIQSTPVEELASGAAPTDVQAALTGLAEGTTYHFRLVAENEAHLTQGPDQTLVTLERAPPQQCENVEFRTGLSAQLPDCRAYELVTPADTRGVSPYAAGTGGTGGRDFNNWLVAPRGPGAGDSLVFFLDGTLPGFEGDGGLDGYRAQRASGAHPATGWQSALLSPSYTQAGADIPTQLGVASDQLYSFWEVQAAEVFDGTLPTGTYLRTPSGFEALGEGSLGIDPKAAPRFLSPGGAHVFFTSKEHLQAEAAPQGTEAVYDRPAGSAAAEVVSVQPDGSPFLAGEDATYLAATEDGSAVAFKVGGALYVHRHGATSEIAAVGSTFAGLSEDGERAFYASGPGTEPADLFVCDLQGGPCAGAGAEAPTQIASDAIFVNVSADGSRVYFESKSQIGGQGVAGQPNLYLWEGGATPRLVAVLDSQDLSGFAGNIAMSLTSWTTVIRSGLGIGRGNSPARSTPSGTILAFQSHAQLTAYDNEGHGEIYRYSSASPGTQIACVSCDPSGAPPSADAMLQTTPSSVASGTPVQATTMIPNLTDDGQRVFFQSADRLLPEDANAVQDVYEWKAQGVGGCERTGGCLALISSGQGETASYLYGMSADGHDVFFRTSEKLVGADLPGSPSIYDARIDGGIPDPPATAPCQGDACQGQGSGSPALPSTATTGAGNGNEESVLSTKNCAKGKHRVKGRCIPRKHHKKQRKHRANHKRRVSR